MEKEQEAAVEEKAKPVCTLTPEELSRFLRWQEFERAEQTSAKLLIGAVKQQVVEGQKELSRQNREFWNSIETAHPELDPNADYHIDSKTGEMHLCTAEHGVPDFAKSLMDALGGRAIVLGGGKRES